jgi:hypothetical protein
LSQNYQYEEVEEFSALKVFHNCGVRNSFYFEALHRDGLGIRLSACHCHFCIRGYCEEGFGTMPTGCVKQEPYQYIVVQRLDDAWVKEKENLITNLSNTIVTLKPNMIVALASERVENWKAKDTSFDKYVSFDIAKVIAQEETGEGGEMYSVNIYSRINDSNIYNSNALSTTIVSHSIVRYILEDSVEREDGTILVDQDCLKTIVFKCFNGFEQESL